MERAEAEGRDPEQELRQAVERTVLQGVAQGFQLSESSAAPEGPDVKRSRTDDGT
jgi:hypothetical protein